MSDLAAHPDLCLLMLLAGILLIYVECNRPGWILPGCAGGLLSLLALHELASFPLRPYAFVSIAGGMTLMLTEVLWRTWRVATAFGILLLTWGLRSLVQPSASSRVHLPVAFFVSLVLGLTTEWLGRIALRARRNKRLLTRQASA